jgi:hypothetical protein
MLYSMMGQFSPGLSYLRLELTVVGAIAGAVAATLILPTRTHVFVVHQTAIFFSEVCGVMACGANRTSNTSSTRRLRSASRRPGVPRMRCSRASPIGRLRSPTRCAARQWCATLIA